MMGAILYKPCIQFSNDKVCTVYQAFGCVTVSNIQG